METLIVFFFIYFGFKEEIISTNAYLNCLFSSCNFYEFILANSDLLFILPSSEAKQTLLLVSCYSRALRVTTLRHFNTLPNPLIACELEIFHSSSLKASYR